MGNEQRKLPLANFSPPPFRALVCVPVMLLRMRKSQGKGAVVRLHARGVRLQATVADKTLLRLGIQVCVCGALSILFAQIYISYFVGVHQVGLVLRKPRERRLRIGVPPKPRHSQEETCAPKKQPQKTVQPGCCMNNDSMQNLYRGTTFTRTL